MSNKIKAWLRVGMYIHLDKAAYTQPELEAELQKKLDSLTLPEGFELSGETYMPDGEIHNENNEAIGELYNSEVTFEF